MITIDKNKNITISKGDIFDVTFKLNGLTLSSEDSIYFSVKDKLIDEEAQLTHKVLNTDISTNSFRVIIPTSEMQALEVGQYLYDLVYINKEGNKRTLIDPSFLIIKEVIHNDLLKG